MPQYSAADGMIVETIPQDDIVKHHTPEEMANQSASLAAQIVELQTKKAAIDAALAAL
jgi:hypothetical protein